MPRIKRVESQREQERAVDDFRTRGYKIKEQSRYTAKVKKKEWGDLPVHGFLFLFTLIGGAILFDAAGISAGGVWIVTIGANITYAAYSRLTAEEIIIKVDGQSTA